MKSNIVYQYFKKDINGKIFFLQIDPIQLKGSQLIIEESGEMEMEEMEFEKDFSDHLIANGFHSANALEFHIRLNGLK